MFVYVAVSSPSLSSLDLVYVKYTFLQRHLLDNNIRYISTYCNIYTLNKTSDKIYKITFLTVSDMGKRYYCDYCDKSFADSPTLRKNHMNGVHHHRNKKAHYDSMRGAEEILSEEQSKKSCKVFLSTGERESFDFVTKHFF